MKTKGSRWVWLIASAFLTPCVAGQDKPSPKKDEKPSPRAIDPKAAKPESMEQWMKATMPGPGHKRLESLIGKWKLVLKSPGAKPGEWTESSGKAEFRWGMGGRFLIEEVSATLDGQPFEWMGIHGFDNIKKTYNSAWIDNFGTGIDFMTGTWDDAKNSLTYTGDVDNPSTGGKTKTTWQISLPGLDKFTVAMLEGEAAGKPVKVLEILATRDR